MTKIGIMGGSFNPIHNAHLAMGIKAYEEFSLDKIIFMPNSHTYYKKDHESVTDSDRCNMISLAIDDYSFMELDETEIIRGGLTYTIDTVHVLKDIYKDSELFFIIGGDSLKHLSSWVRADELFKELIFLVTVRDDIDIAATTEIISRYKVEYPGADLRLMSLPAMDISSSDIRNRIKNDESIDGLTVQSVVDYIYSHNLYI